MLKARPRPAFSPPHRRKRHIVALREGDPFLLFLLFCFLLFWDGGAAQYLSRYSPYQYTGYGFTVYARGIYRKIDSKSRSG